MPEEDGSRLASNKRKLRTLLFSSLYPSSIRPGHGIFVETRLRELLGSSQVETRVVSPVPWFFSTNPRFGEYALIASTPARERHHGIDVLHPRYFLPPRFGMTVAPLSMAIGALPAIRKLQVRLRFRSDRCALFLSRWCRCRHPRKVAAQALRRHSARHRSEPDSPACPATQDDRVGGTRCRGVNRCMCCVSGCLARLGAAGSAVAGDA